MTGRFTSSAWRWIKDTPEADTKPSPKALADLDRRKALGPRADITGRMLGDPPPGRSALEQKLEGERKRAAAIKALAATNEDGEQ